jgi:hypothetical protein
MSIQIHELQGIKVDINHHNQHFDGPKTRLVVGY